MKSLAIATTFVLLLTAITEAKVIENAETGKPAIQSINAISFAPEGVLLIGDGRGKQIIAIETGDTKAQGGLQKKIVGITEKMAGLIGAKAAGIELLDMAVNPASGTAYFAVRKQDSKTHLIFTVDSKGKISEFELDKVSYARLELTAAEGVVSLVTDVAWAEDRVIAAGRSNETFGSKIFSIDAPLKHGAKSRAYSAETYHVSHRRWETKAPMSVILPLKENDKTYVVGAFSCTPVVKYPLDAIQPNAKVKGSSVIELGSGNRPIDMFVYKKAGKSYVLSNTFRFHHERKPFGPSPYWTVKFEQSLLLGNETVNEKAVRRLKGDKATTDRIQMVDEYHGVMQMDQLDEERALVIRKTETGADLEPLALP
ncbi:MAG: hypothetical protein ACI9G1_005397 [Pirellulaceae bacterium]|jgi:hypothetical protein